MRRVGKLFRTATSAIEAGFKPTPATIAARYSLASSKHVAAAMAVRQIKAAEQPAICRC